MNDNISGYLKEAGQEKKVVRGRIKKEGEENKIRKIGEKCCAPSDDMDNSVRQLVIAPIRVAGGSEVDYEGDYKGNEPKYFYPIVTSRD